jgi:hypothetical protein
MNAVGVLLSEHHIRRCHKPEANDLAAALSFLLSVQIAYATIRHCPFLWGEDPFMYLWKNPVDCRFLFPYWKDFRLRGSSRTGGSLLSRESLLVALIHWAKNTGREKKLWTLQSLLCNIDYPVTPVQPSPVIKSSATPLGPEGSYRFDISLQPPETSIQNEGWTSTPSGISKSFFPLGLRIRMLADVKSK